jgi:hypothetical protein
MYDVPCLACLGTGHAPATEEPAPKQGEAERQKLIDDVCSRVLSNGERVDGRASEPTTVNPVGPSSCVAPSSGQIRGTIPAGVPVDDDANPAWWRGHDVTAEQMTRRLAEALGLAPDTAWQHCIKAARKRVPVERVEALRDDLSRRESECSSCRLGEGRKSGLRDARWLVLDLLNECKTAKPDAGGGG